MKHCLRRVYADRRENSLITPLSEGISNSSKLKGISGLFLIFLLLFSVQGYCRHGARPFHLSTEMIDAPLVLPAHMWQVYVPAFVDFYINRPGETFFWDGLVYPLAPSVPRHSLTDRFEFPNFPFPYVRIALRQKTEISDAVVRLQGLALSLEGGLTEVSYSQVQGVEFDAGVIMRAKRRLSERLWLEGKLSVSSEITHDDQNVYVSLSPFIGLQATQHVALGLWYSPRSVIYPNVVFRQSVEGLAYLFPNPYFGITLGCYAFSYHSYWQIQPKIAATFQW